MGAPELRASGSYTKLMLQPIDLDVVIGHRSPMQMPVRDFDALRAFRLKGYEHIESRARDARSVAAGDGALEPH